MVVVIRVLIMHTVSNTFACQAIIAWALHRARHLSLHHPHRHMTDIEARPRCVVSPIDNRLPFH